MSVFFAELKFDMVCNEIVPNWTHFFCVCRVVIITMQNLADQLLLLYTHVYFAHSVWESEKNCNSLKNAVTHFCERVFFSFFSVSVSGDLTKSFINTYIIHVWICKAQNYHFSFCKLSMTSSEIFEFKKSPEKSNYTY